VARVRAADPDMPVGVGLGVGTGAQAAEVAAFADGVIVGSALVRCVLDADDATDADRRLRTLSAELAEGVRTRP
jgi:tryptophan synthase alpha chain